MKGTQVKVKYLFVILFLILLQGCIANPKYHIDIDSISATNSKVGNSFILIPGTKEIKEGDLQYQEFSGYIIKALESKGYKKVSSILDADLAIYLVYGIGDPETQQYTYSVPIYGQTGVSSSTTSGTITSNGNYSGRTTHTPTYGVTGSSMRTKSYTTYFRYMILEAIDVQEYKKTKVEKQVWKTTVTSTGSSGDLRQVFPILVAASKSYIGTNTGRKIQVKLLESDKSVLAVKGIKVTPPPKKNSYIE